MILEFNNFLDKHKGESCIICGCGSSLNLLKEHKTEIIKFGVNDVPRLFNPNYLIVVDHPHKFRNGRDLIISNSEAGYVFTQLPDWSISSGRKVLFKLGTKSRLDNLDKKDFIIDWSNNSPYISCIIAYKMGFTNIAILGVDFTPNHFYAEDGNHNLITSGRLEEVKSDFLRLYEAFKVRNINFYNLSPISEVKTVPYLSIEEYLKINKNVNENINPS